MLQKQPFKDVFQIRCPQEFRKIYRKTSVSKSLFDKLAGLMVFLRTLLKSICERLLQSPGGVLKINCLEISGKSETMLGSPQTSQMESIVLLQSSPPWMLAEGPGLGSVKSQENIAGEIPCGQVADSLKPASITGIFMKISHIFR